MRTRDLKARLRELGWWFLREGSNHEVWTNGKLNEYVPRHTETKEPLAKAILKRAAANPPA
jgi:mRNA interferase HicA